MNSNDDEFDEASKGIQPEDEPVFSVDRYSPAVYRWDPAHERKVFADKTRRRLAYLIIGVVLLLDVALVVAFIWSAFNGGNQFSREDFSQVIANLAGPNALAAAVIGFYYGKTSDSD